MEAIWSLLLGSSTNQTLLAVATAVVHQLLPSIAVTLFLRNSFPRFVPFQNEKRFNNCPGLIFVPCNIALGPCEVMMIAKCQSSSANFLLNLGTNLRMLSKVQESFYVDDVSRQTCGSEPCTEAPRHSNARHWHRCRRCWPSVVGLEKEPLSGYALTPLPSLPPKMSELLHRHAYVQSLLNERFTV